MGSRKAKRSGGLEAYKTPFQQFGWKQLCIALFWQLDVIGIILVIAGTCPPHPLVVLVVELMTQCSFRSDIGSIYACRRAERPVEEHGYHRHDWYAFRNLGFGSVLTLMMLCVVLGVACVPALVFWELKAKHPLIPFAVRQAC